MGYMTISKSSIKKVILDDRFNVRLTIPSIEDSTAVMFSTNYIEEAVKFLLSDCKIIYGFPIVYEDDDADDESIMPLYTNIEIYDTKYNEVIRSFDLNKMPLKTSKKFINKRPLQSGMFNLKSGFPS